MAEPEDTGKSPIAVTTGRTSPNTEQLVVSQSSKPGASAAHREESNTDQQTTINQVQDVKSFQPPERYGGCVTHTPNAKTSQTPEITRDQIVTTAHAPATSPASTSPQLPLSAQHSPGATSSEFKLCLLPQPSMKHQSKLKMASSSSDAPAMANGRNSPQYNIVQQNLKYIVHTLKSNTAAYDDLKLSVKTERWLELHDEPKEEKLIAMILDRIENDASEYSKFMNMLCPIHGMDLIAKKLQLPALTSTQPPLPAQHNPGPGAATSGSSTSTSALNENDQHIESTTPSIPSISTGSGDLRMQNIATLRQSSEGGSSTVTGTTQTSNDSNTPLLSKAKKISKLHVKMIKNNPKLSCAFFVLLVLAVVFIIPIFVYFSVYNFSTLKSVTIQSEFQRNDTVALSTVDAFKHRKVKVTLKGNRNPVEIFSASGHCNRLKTGSRPYSYTFQQDASLMHTYSITTDYFATGSKLMFQANTTAKVDLFNCSSAVYIFDDNDSYNNFLGYESTRNFVSRLCFNLSGNGSYYNQVQSYSMKESSYLYIGLYLPPISIASHVDLSISGTQNFYIVADLTSRCNLSSIKTTFQFTVSKNLKTSKHICVLGRGSSSDTEEHVMELQSMNSFPNNFVVVILFTFSLFFFITIIAIILLLCICPCISFCYQNKCVFFSL